jgi:protein TonB
MEQETAPGAANGQRTTLGLSAIAAVAVHAGLLFGWNGVSAGVSISQVVCHCVDVGLVDGSDMPAEAPTGESPEAALPLAVEPPAPTATKTPPTVTVPSEPEVEREKEEMAPLPPQTVASKTATAANAPAPPSPRSPLNRAPLRPAKTLGRSGAGSGASSGIGEVNTLGKPVYLLRPLLSYPAESRAAGEQGVVVLRITVNAGGRPVAVKVGVSSGFSRLDRAAVEGGWRCRVSNAFEGAQFEAPLRFSLQN